MGFVNMMGKETPSVISGQHQAAGAEILALRGEIDLQSSRELRERFFEVVATGPATLVVDMTEVSFMDSSGLATLVETLTRCRKANCRLMLVGIRQRVRSVFEISRLLSVFELFDTQEQALGQEKN